jgi:hypothetical protein
LIAAAASSTNESTAMAIGAMTGVTNSDACLKLRSPFR